MRKPNEIIYDALKLYKQYGRKEMNVCGFGVAKVSAEEEKYIDSLMSDYKDNVRIGPQRVTPGELTNILDHARQIVHERSEEKERQYGKFSEVMARTADAFNAVTGHSITPEETYAFMVVHKLVREKNAHKRDNLLDAAAYIGAWDDYVNTK